MPKRVLLLFTNMNRGGAESMVMSYYRHIDRSKLQFDFMVHREARGDYDDEIEAMGGRIYRMMPFFPLTFPKYKKQIRAFFDEHPEYQIVHGHCSELGYFVYREAARRHLPVIIAHAHNSHAQFDAKWIFRTWFKHRMRKYLTHRFTCGAEAATWLFGKKEGASAILQRNAIDTALYAYDEAARAAIREELHIPHDALVVGHVGRFNRQKNHTFIIDIFAEIAKQAPNAILLLVGNGDLEPAIKEKVNSLHLSDRVIFTGVRRDVPKVLQAMDVFLMPSFMEGLSLSMVEAQCAGLPCVVSNTIPEEVKMTDLVTFHPLNESPSDWAAAVIREAHRPIERAFYRQQIITAGYDIQKNAEWLQEWYLSF